ncbi:MAG: GH3 auxin-responsive promoter family protein [Cyclobacteriaceae bacterium]|nr:GH3 auxin-responsive promoter family protein [Cyclobacteriaceae bacterium]MCH8515650.1 GH3 auxin-responsive promoter family protein [Cyclobacteriaceae bacterium]
MSIIGEILKRAVEISDTIFKNPHPPTAQLEALKQLLASAKDTEFGKKYDFSSLLELEDPREEYAQRVPYFNYEDMKSEWWHRTIAGEEDVTWPGKVAYFAVSSGTTSARKRIPVTDEMIKSIQRGGRQQIKAMADFDLPADFFTKEVLMFGSSTELKEVDGRKEGEISGISASQIPFWFEGFYRPGKEISSITDWDERVDALCREAKNWDIGAISGIPSWIEVMLKRVIEYYQVDTIHDIWPNLQVYTSGGVAFEPYKKGFDRITSQPLTVIDTYLASEGYIATQLRKDTDAMALITDNGIYFEFIPFIPENVDEDGNVKQHVKPIKIEDVALDKDYVLVISTVSGAWRYMIGDTIAFTDKERAEIKITGRTKHFLNVVGSHLSVIQMNRAVSTIEDKSGCDIKEFTVAAVEVDGEYIHRWYLGIDGELCLSTADAASWIDEYLKEHNKNYNVARGKALKGVEVMQLPVDTFQKWTAETKQKGGQVKVPRVMNTKDVEEWEAFISQ